MGSEGTVDEVGPMDEISDQGRSVELLHQLGLEEYEAKSFVALARRERGTAKEISDTSDVPRTRVQHNRDGIPDQRHLADW